MTTTSPFSMILRTSFCGSGCRSHPPLSYARSRAFGFGHSGSVFSASFHKHVRDDNLLPIRFFSASKNDSVPTIGKIICWLNAWGSRMCGGVAVVWPVWGALPVAVSMMSADGRSGPPSSPQRRGPICMSGLATVGMMEVRSFFSAWSENDSMPAIREISCPVNGWGSGRCRGSAVVRPGWACCRYPSSRRS